MNAFEKKIPVIIEGLDLSVSDMQQYRMLFDNIGREILGLFENKGIDATGLKMYVTAGDPVPAKLQQKTATPKITSQSITPSSGYDGLSKVTVSAVTATIDENIVAGNIKSGVVILGVTGTYTGEEDPEESGGTGDPEGTGE